MRQYRLEVGAVFADSLGLYLLPRPQEVRRAPCIK